jgi:hypothetical protein
MTKPPRRSSSNRTLAFLCLCWPHGLLQAFVVRHDGMVRIYSGIFIAPPPLSSYPSYSSSSIRMILSPPSSLARKSLPSAALSGPLSYRRRHENNRRTRTAVAGWQWPSWPSEKKTFTKTAKDIDGLVDPETKRYRAVLSARVEEFLACLQDERRIGHLKDLLQPQAEWHDLTLLYEPLRGVDAIERHLRFELLAKRKRVRNLVVQDTVLCGRRNRAAILLVENEEPAGIIRDGSTSSTTTATHLRSLVTLQFDQTDKKIVKVVWSTESRTKTGEGSLRVLAAASTLLLPAKQRNTEPEKKDTDDVGNENEAAVRPRGAMSSMDSVPERYYDAWNARDIDAAVAMFTSDAVYDDTAFAIPLVGAEAIRRHLTLCADCFPSSFQFAPIELIDDDDRSKVAMEWCVVNNGVALPFTRGLSIYYVGDDDRISKGIDFVDGTPIKTSGLERFAQIVAHQIAQEPIRLVPWSVWLIYLYVVFLSDGILPGANALALEARTWEEVRDLSLNFFLVAPTLHLSFSPTTVHPMLESVFNLLLSWAAMFVAFATDDRREKPSILPFGPTVLGMQLLTSAFLLPYLATRTSETTTTMPVPSTAVATRPVEQPTGVLYAIAENRLVPSLLLLVGSYSLYWGLFGRVDIYGAALDMRWASFVDLLSIDRVGSSFLVDLAIFGLFQSWWIDDDLRRRGVMDGEQTLLRTVAKFVPFFGLGFYLLLRPPLDCPPSSNGVDNF